MPTILKTNLGYNFEELITLGKESVKTGTICGLQDVKRGFAQTPWTIFVRDNVGRNKLTSRTLLNAGNKHENEKKVFSAGHVFVFKGGTVLKNPK